MSIVQFTRFKADDSLVLGCLRNKNGAREGSVFFDRGIECQIRFDRLAIWTASALRSARLFVVFVQ